MKKIATIVNFLLLTILAWIVVLFVTNSSLLTISSPIGEEINQLTKVFVYPQLIFHDTNNFAAQAYLSLSYILIFLVYLNIFAFSFIKSRFSSDKGFRISTSHELSSFLWESVYSKITPPIYFHPDSVGYEQRLIQESAISQFAKELIQADKTKVYFLVLFALGFILIPYFCADSLNIKTHRLVAFWNLSLVMVYLQFKFIFEAIFIFVSLLPSKNLNKES